MKGNIGVGAFLVLSVCVSGSVYGQRSPALVAFLDDKADSKPKPPAEETTAPYDSTTHGAVQVKGDTSDWFVVQQGGKQAGKSVPPRLNGILELVPGTYEVFVNKSKRTVKVAVGKVTVLQTGTLVVEGKNALWYTPYQRKEPRVVANPPRLNTPIALFPGTYSVRVRVGDKDEVLTDDARVVAGQKTVLKK